MCGFAALISLTNELSHNDPKVNKMTHALLHRGPDDIGFIKERKAHFGFARLSIRDIENGKQPMESLCGRYVIIFNGEIYNTENLNEALTKRGVTLRTSSDTEVLLNILIIEGVSGLEQIFGMFAFVFYDRHEHKAIIARDRIGIKPVYVHIGKDEVFIASEQKAIQAGSSLTAEFNPTALSSYLSFRYPMWNNTFIKGIERLKPGHFYTVDANGLQEFKYWSIPVTQEKYERPASLIIEEGEELLTQVVKQHLIADVDVGILLSGGLDSSLIAAIAAPLLDNKGVSTYSIGFLDDGYDESKYARMVADQYQLNHNHFYDDPNTFLDDTTSLIKHRGTPLSIPHEIAINKLFHQISLNQKVVLSGEGADELFGGYGRVQRSAFDYQKRLWLNSIPLPTSLQQNLANLLEIGDIDTGAGLCDTFLSRYYWWPNAEKRKLFTDEFSVTINNDALENELWLKGFEDVKKMNYHQQILYMFQTQHLQCLLDRLDSHSMAHGVEARVPFCDHRLIEFAAKVPLNLKFKWNSLIALMRSLYMRSDNFSERHDTSKVLLRRIGEKYLPLEISHRKKLGFPVPLDIWTREVLMKSYKEILLDGKTNARHIFRKGYLEDILTQASDDKGYDFWGKKIWMLMNFEIWMRECIDA
jgi:asparagine synthase (glutamine-hydrolysing)